MNKFAKILVTALAIACAMVAVAQTKPKDALKAISDFRQSQFTEARAANKQPDFAEIDRKAKDKAIDAIKGVDAAKVDPKEAYDWAELFQMAGKDKDACDLCHLFLTTNPNAADKFRTQSMMMKSCNALGEADMLMATLREVKPTDFNGASELTSYAVYEYADTIQKAKGTQATLDTLDAVAKSFPARDNNAIGQQMFDQAKKNPNYKGTGTESEQLATFVQRAADQEAGVKLSIAQKEAELYVAEHRKDDAVKTLDDFAKTLDPKSRVLKQTNLVKTQITLPGLMAPAVNMERGYGQFPGLEAMKGKIVILDFFAHWCPPCKAEFPDMIKLAADLKSKGVEVVGVTTYYGYYKQERGIDKNTEYARMADFIKEFNLPWPVVYGDRANFDEYGVTGIPHVVIIDRDGKVHNIHIGYSPELFKELRKDIEDLAGK